MQCIFIKAIQNRNTSTENVSYHRFTEFDDTDFESNLGMWTNAYDDKLNWQRHSGYTQTLNTGPSSDHTLGKYNNNNNNNNNEFLYRIEKPISV